MAVAVRDGYLSGAITCNGGTQYTSVLVGRKLGNRCPDLNLLPLDLLSVTPTNPTDQSQSGGVKENA